MIETRQLRVLHAVATTGSFSAAARSLGVSQPAVAQQMKALESVAKTPLLVRQGQKLRLTHAGEALARRASGILARLTMAEEEVTVLAGLQAGRVRLASFASASAALVPSALAALRLSHPETQVSVSTTEPARAVQMLHDGSCDVALAFSYGGDYPGWDRLDVRPLFNDPLLGLVPDYHTVAHQEAVDLATLANEPWVAGWCRQHLVDICTAAGFVPQIDFAVDSYPTVKGMVNAGCGVALVPSLALQSLPLHGVRPVVLESPVHRRIVAITLPQARLYGAVSTVLDALAHAG